MGEVEEGGDFGGVRILYTYLLIYPPPLECNACTLVSSYLATKATIRLIEEHGTKMRVIESSSLKGTSQLI